MQGKLKRTRERQAVCGRGGNSWKTTSRSTLVTSSREPTANASNSKATAAGNSDMQSARGAERPPVPTQIFLSRCKHQYFVKTSCSRYGTTVCNTKTSVLDSNTAVLDQRTAAYSGQQIFAPHNNVGSQAKTCKTALCIQARQKIKQRRRAFRFVPLRNYKIGRRNLS